MIVFKKFIKGLSVVCAVVMAHLIATISVFCLFGACVMDSDRQNKIPAKKESTQPWVVMTGNGFAVEGNMSQGECMDKIMEIHRDKKRCGEFVTYYCKNEKTGMNMGFQ